MANPGFPDYEVLLPSLPPDSFWKSESTFTYSLISGTLKAANNNLAGIFPRYSDLQYCLIGEPDFYDENYNVLFCGDDPNWEDIVEDFSGPATYVGVWLSLALIFTITGIVWCICNKCLCCCIGEKKVDDLDFLENTDGHLASSLGQYNVSHKDSKKQVVWKVVLGVLMGLLILGFTYTMFISAASNENLRKSLFDIGDDLTNVLDDAEIYVNVTQQQINATFLGGFEVLAGKIRNETQQGSSKSLVSELFNTSETLLSKLKSFESHADVNLYGSMLSGLSHSLHTLRSFIKRPNFGQGTPGIVEGTKLLDFEEALNKTVEELLKNSNDLINALDEIPVVVIREQVEEAKDDWLDTVGTAIYGTFLGFNIVLFIIFVALVVGAVLVWVGAWRKSMQRTGFIFLRFSIVMMFVFGWFIVCVMLTQFATTGFVSQIACDRVREFEDDAGHNETDWGKYCEENPSTWKPTNETEDGYRVPAYSHVVRTCKNDGTAYTAFDLIQVYNICSIFTLTDHFNPPSLTPSQLVQKELDTIALTKMLRVITSYEAGINETLKSPEANALGIHALHSKLIDLLKTILKKIDGPEHPQPFQEVPPVIVDMVKEFERFVFKQVTEKIGNCKPMYNVLNSTLHTFCYKVMSPVATYWWSLQLLSILLSFIIITALVTQRIYK